MYIVEIASECAPVAKVGGLADVVYGLTRELSIRGNYVEIILPKYDVMRYEQIWGLTVIYNDLWVPWYGASIHCTVWFGYVHGHKCFFVDPHSGDNYFNRNRYYGSDDDIMRFAFFCKASLEFLLKTNRRPSVIHCHDWQTGLVPVLLFEMYKFHGMWDQRVCFTIHNFRHQGISGGEVLWATGLGRPEYFFDYEKIRDNFNPFALNLTKGAIVYSNFVTTVSPHHAWETRTKGYGFGLEPTLDKYQSKYGGILNGVEYDVWNPEIDRFIPAQYSCGSVQEKYRNKESLRDRLWLSKNFKPIISYVGRLDEQKGLNLIYHAVYFALSHGAQFVLLGVGSNSAINDWFGDLKKKLNDNPDCHIELGFDEELSHLIYAGSDMIIVPSIFEPCGLTQMIALKYGTVPIVSSVGGLVNTVFDRDYSEKPWPERNGYKFKDLDYGGIESAMIRAIGLYYDYPQLFRELMLNGMRYDFSWNCPGTHYLNIFEYIRHK